MKNGLRPFIRWLENLSMHQAQMAVFRSEPGLKNVWYLMQPSSKSRGLRAMNHDTVLSTKISPLVKR